MKVLVVPESMRVHAFPIGRIINSFMWVPNKVAANCAVG